MLRVAFAMQMLLTFFSKKYQCICHISKLFGFICFLFLFGSGVWEGLRFVVVVLPGLFSLTFFFFVCLFVCCCFFCCCFFCLFFVVFFFCFFCFFLFFFLMKQSCPRSGAFFMPIIRDNRPTSAISALIFNCYEIAIINLMIL